MAQDIKSLGESLLGQAKKRRKKLEKRQKIFSGLMLGVSVGNIFLRRQAEKRMNQFINSNAGILQNQKRQFTQGVNFWSDHETMMKTYGMGSSDTDWENAFKQKQYDFYKKRDLDGISLNKLTSTRRREFELEVDKLIKDDIEGYSKKMDLFQNFKNIENTAENRKLYMKPLTDELLKGSKLIQKEGTVGNFLLNKLGLKKRGLETVKLGDTEVVIPEALKDEDRDILRKNIVRNEVFSQSLDDINKNIQYVPLSSDNIKKFTDASFVSSKPNASFVTEVTQALNANPKKRGQSLVGVATFDTSFGKGKSFYQIYNQIFKGDKSGASNEAFLSEIYAFAAQAKKDFEDNPENIGKVVLPSQFVKEGIQLAIANNPTLAYKESTDEIIEKREFQLDIDFSNEEFTIDKVDDVTGVSKPFKFKPINSIAYFTKLAETDKNQFVKEFAEYENDLKSIDMPEQFIASRDKHLNIIRGLVDIEKEQVIQGSPLSVEFLTEYKTREEKSLLENIKRYNKQLEIGDRGPLSGGVGYIRLAKNALIKRAKTIFEFSDNVTDDEIFNFLKSPLDSEIKPDNFDSYKNLFQQ